VTDALRKGLTGLDTMMSDAERDEQRRRKHK
jgi:hypothetical protein